MGLPRYSLGEEIFSSVSHGVSALGAIAALALLLVFCEKTPIKIASVAVYGGAMVTLYAISCIYHGLGLGLSRAKIVFRSLDHCTIFLLIAGTYTPITLVCIGGWQGTLMLAGVWAAAIAGVILNAISVERFKVVSMICYLMMGPCCAAWAKRYPICTRCSTCSCSWAVCCTRCAYTSLWRNIYVLRLHYILKRFRIRVCFFKKRAHPF